MNVLIRFKLSNVGFMVSNFRYFARTYKNVLAPNKWIIFINMNHFWNIMPELRSSQDDFLLLSKLKNYTGKEMEVPTSPTSPATSDFMPFSSTLVDFHSTPRSIYKLDLLVFCNVFIASCTPDVQTLVFLHSRVERKVGLSRFQAANQFTALS